MNGAMGKVRRGELTRGAMPFMLAWFAVLLAWVAFPSLLRVPARWFDGHLALLSDGYA